MRMHTSSNKHDLSIHSSVASFFKGTTGDNHFLFREVWIYYDIAYVQMIPFRTGCGGYMFVVSAFQNWRSTSKNSVIGANYPHKTPKKTLETPISRRDSANFSCLPANTEEHIKKGDELRL